MHKGFHKNAAQMPNQGDSSAMTCKELLVSAWGALNTM